MLIATFAQVSAPNGRARSPGAQQWRPRHRRPRTGQRTADHPPTSTVSLATRIGPIRVANLTVGGGGGGTGAMTDDGRLLILISGPYPTGTDGDEAKIAANLARMEAMAGPGVRARPPRGGR